MKTVDSLNWVFAFGKHKHQSIKEAIQNSPSFSSAGIIDIHGKTHGKGRKLFIDSSLISYLKWAQNEGILIVLPEVWEEIENYDHLYVTIESYKNGSKEITAKSYEEYLEKYYKLNDEEEEVYYDIDTLNKDDIEPRYDWVKRYDDEDVWELQELSIEESCEGKGLTMEEHKKRGSHIAPIIK